MPNFASSPFKGVIDEPTYRAKHLPRWRDSLENNVIIMKTLIREKAEVDEEVQRQLSGRILKVELSDATVIKTLIQARRTIAKEDLVSLFKWIVKEGNLEIVEMLLKHADKIEYRIDPSSLWLAVRRGDPAIVETLIEHVDETVYASNPDIFWLAVKEGNLEIVEMLLKHADKIEYRIDSSILRLALARGGDPAIVETLIKHVDETVYASDPYIFGLAVHSGNVEIVKILLEAGVNVHEKDRLGYPSLLSMPIGQKNLEITKMLIQAGVKIPVKGGAKETSLYWSNLAFVKEIIREYLITNVDPEKPDDLPIKMSTFWDEYQLKMQVKIEEISKTMPYFNEHIRITDESQLVNVISGMCRRNSQIVDKLKSLFDEEFIDLFGDRLRNGVIRYQKTKNALRALDTLSGRLLPKEIWWKIFEYSHTDYLPTFRRLFQG